MASHWYTEKYGPTDIKAKSHEEFADFASVRSLILGARRSGTNEIIRVLAPYDARSEELDQLRALGAQPT